MFSTMIELVAFCLIGVFWILILFGHLVPRGTVLEAKRDRDEWRALANAVEDQHRALREQIHALTPGDRTAFIAHKKPAKVWGPQHEEILSSLAEHPPVADHEHTWVPVVLCTGETVNEICSNPTCMIDRPDRPHNDRWLRLGEGKIVPANEATRWQAYYAEYRNSPKADLQD